MAGIDRDEGYRRGRPKEEAAIQLAEDFLARYAGIATDRVTGRRDNYLYGDLQCRGLQSFIEVKGQAVLPKWIIEGKGYASNFIEVFEDVSVDRKPVHEGGFDALATLLDLTPEALEKIPVTDRRRGREGKVRQPLGRLSHVSVSISNFATSRAVLYVNTREQLLVAYDSRALLGEIRSVAPQGFDLGKGGANDVTHSVQVEYGDMIWKREGTESRWSFRGRCGTAEAARERLRTILGVSST